MAEFINDAGSFNRDAQFSGTKGTNYNYDATTEAVWFSLTGTCDTGFVLPDVPWVLFEVYAFDSETQSTLGDDLGGDNVQGKKEWTSDLTGGIASVLSAWRTDFINNGPFTTFSIKATHYTATAGDVVDVYEATNATAFSTATLTDVSLVLPATTWKITDVLFADTVNSSLYAGDEFDTDPFSDSSLITRFLFNDDATALVGTDGTLNGTNGDYTDGFLQEAYTVTTPATTEYFAVNNSIPSGAHSVSCFVKLQANTEGGTLQDDGNAIFGAGDITSTPYIFLVVWDDGGISYHMSTTGGVSNVLYGNVSSGAYPSDGEWHHLVATYSGTATIGEISLYLDGIKLSVTGGETGTYVNRAYTGARIGSTWWNHASYYVTLKGSVDQFDIYDKELTVAEVNEIGIYREYAGTENDTDPFSDSSLDMRLLFNDDATALVGSNATLNGTNGDYTAGFLQEAYTVTTPATTEYMTLGNGLPSGAWSISCFAKLYTNSTHGSSTTDRNSIVGMGGDNNSDYMLWGVRDDGSMVCQMGNGTSDANWSFSDAGDFQMNDGRFHHIVVTYGGSGTSTDTKMKFYVDGALVNKSNGGGGTFSDTALTDGRVGASWWDMATYWSTFKGSIDQLDFYDKELTLTEVNEIGFS